MDTLFLSLLAPVGFASPTVTILGPYSAFISWSKSLQIYIVFVSVIIDPVYIYVPVVYVILLFNCRHCFYSMLLSLFK